MATKYIDQMVEIPQNLWAWEKPPKYRMRSLSSAISKIRCTAKKRRRQGIVI